MSTATIYAHRYDAGNDEATGVVGGGEADAPADWRFSVEVAKAWERALGIEKAFYCFIERNSMLSQIGGGLLRNHRRGPAFLLSC